MEIINMIVYYPYTCFLIEHFSLNIDIVMQCLTRQEMMLKRMPGSIIHYSVGIIQYRMENSI